MYIHIHLYLYIHTYFLHIYFYSFILKIPFCGQPLKTHGRPRPVLSSPFLSPLAHPARRIRDKHTINSILKKRTKRLRWRGQCGSKEIKRQHSLWSAAAYKHQVWKSCTIRELLIVAELSFSRPRASFMSPHLSFTVPFCSIHSAFPLPVCTEGRGQAAVPFLPAVATKCFVKPPA